MGLDNSVSIRVPKGTHVSKYFEFEYEIDGYDYYGVVYYRKCWNVRAGVIEALDLMPDGTRKEMNMETCTFPISRDEVRRIRDVIKSLNKKKIWDEWGSIWLYKEIKNKLKDDIKQLNRLIKKMKKHPEYQVVWVDSY